MKNDGTLSAATTADGDLTLGTNENSARKPATATSAYGATYSVPKIFTESS